MACKKNNPIGLSFLLWNAMAFFLIPITTILWFTMSSGTGLGQAPFR